MADDNEAQIGLFLKGVEEIQAALQKMGVAGNASFDEIKQAAKNAENQVKELERGIEVLKRDKLQKRVNVELIDGKKELLTLDQIKAKMAQVVDFGKALTSRLTDLARSSEASAKALRGAQEANRLVAAGLEQQPEKIARVKQAYADLEKQIDKLAKDPLKTKDQAIDLQRLQSELKLNADRLKELTILEQKYAEQIAATNAVANARAAAVSRANEKTLAEQRATQGRTRIDKQLEQFGVLPEVGEITRQKRRQEASVAFTQLPAQQIPDLKDAMSATRAEVNELAVAEQKLISFQQQINQQLGISLPKGMETLRKRTDDLRVAFSKLPEALPQIKQSIDEIQGQINQQLGIRLPKGEVATQARRQQATAAFSQLPTNLQLQQSAAFAFIATAEDARQKEQLRKNIAESKASRAASQFGGDRTADLRAQNKELKQLTTAYERAKATIQQMIDATTDEKDVRSINRRIEALGRLQTALDKSLAKTAKIDPGLQSVLRAEEQRVTPIRTGEGSIQATIAKAAKVAKVPVLTPDLGKDLTAQAVAIDKAVGKLTQKYLQAARAAEALSKAQKGLSTPELAAAEKNAANYEKALEAILATSQKIGNNTTNMARGFAALDAPIKSVGFGIKELFNNITRLGFAVFALQATLSALLLPLFAIKKAFVDTNAQLQQAQLAFAGTFQNQFVEDFGTSMKRAEQFVGELRKEAVKTNLTFQELFETSTSALPQLLARGATPNQALEVTSLIAQQSKLILGDRFAPGRVQDEIRALLNKNIVGKSNETLLSLGITKESLKNVKDVTDLVELLRAKTIGLRQANVLFQQTFQGAMERAQDSFFRLAADVGKPLFETVTQSLVDFNNAMASGDFNGFIDGLRSVIEILALTADQVINLGKEIGKLLSLMRDSTGGEGGFVDRIGKLFSNIPKNISQDLRFKAFKDNPLSARRFTGVEIAEIETQLQKELKKPVVDHSIKTLFGGGPLGDLGVITPAEKEDAKFRLQLLSQIRKQRQDQQVLGALDAKRRFPAVPLGKPDKAKKPKFAPTGAFIDSDQIDKVQNAIEKINDALEIADNKTKTFQAVLDTINPGGLEQINEEARALEEKYQLLIKAQIELTKITDEADKQEAFFKQKRDNLAEKIKANPKDDTARHDFEIANRQFNLFRQQANAGHRELLSINKQFTDVEVAQIRNTQAAKDKANELRQEIVDLKGEITGLQTQRVDEVTAAFENTAAKVRSLDAQLQAVNTRIAELNVTATATIFGKTVEQNKKEQAAANAELEKAVLLQQKLNEEKRNEQRQGALNALQGAIDITKLQQETRATQPGKFSKRELDQSQLAINQAFISQIDKLLQTPAGTTISIAGKGDFQIDDNFKEQLLKIKNDFLQTSLDIKSAWQVNVVDSLKSAFDKLFDNILEGTANFKQVFLDLLKDIARQFERIFSEKFFGNLAKQFADKFTFINAKQAPGLSGFAGALGSASPFLPGLTTQFFGKISQNTSALEDTAKSIGSFGADVFAKAKGLGTPQSQTAAGNIMGIAISKSFISGFTKIAPILGGLIGLGFAAKNVLTKGNRTGAAVGGLGGALLGGTLGFALGGPVGAFAGAGIGAGVGSGFGKKFITDKGDLFALAGGGLLGLGIRKLFTGPNKRRVAEAAAAGSEKLQKFADSISVDTLSGLEAAQSQLIAEYNSARKSVDKQKGKGTKNAKKEAKAQLKSQLASITAQLAKVREQLEAELTRLVEEIDLNIEELKRPVAVRGLAPELTRSTNDLKELIRKGVDKNKVLEFFNLQIQDTLRETQDALDQVNEQLTHGAENNRGELISLQQALTDEIDKIKTDAEKQRAALREGFAGQAGDILSQGRAAAIPLTQKTRQAQLASLFGKQSREEAALNTETQNAILRQTNETNREIADLNKQQNDILSRIQFLLTTAIALGPTIDPSFNPAFIQSLQSFTTAFNPFQQIALSPVLQGGLGVTIENLIIPQDDATLGARIRQEIDNYIASRNQKSAMQLA